MAVAKAKKSNEVITGIAGKTLIPTPLENEVSKSFLEYSMSVVYSRAIPSVVDGFKPVQRRILFSMFEEGFLPEKNFVKSAKPVSTTMGGYHPHGDSSIYEALVKLSQPFYLNIPLVEGYGNFGDVTGSPAAASRYTECKLSKEALQLLSELKEDTVDMRDNYSGDKEEPVHLPSRFPNLLINGNFGIAVGFASKFAPHNPSEAMNAAKYLLKNPNATTEQLMKYIPGPDFPTGACILGTDGIKQAYETGQGIIRLQSKYEINATGRGKHEIVFTELPYGTKTETILTKIGEGMKNGKLVGIADAKDLTDRRNGLKFVVDVKTGINPNALLVELFKNTPLEDSFGINNTALVNGEPKVVSLKEILEHFLAHRIEVVTRRTTYRKEKRTARLHLVEGLLKALANIDEVIRIVRAASDATTAQENLIKKFKVDEIQADYILGIPLRRLTKFDQIELNDEKEKLLAEIAELQAILDDDDVLRAVIAKELDETKKVINQERRSEIIGGSLAEHMEVAKKIASSVEVADEPCFISLTAKGSIVRNAKPARGAIATIETTTRGRFVIVTNKGNAFRIDALHVGEKGSPVSSVLPSKLPTGEKVITLAGAVAKDDKAVSGLAMGTRFGVVKLQDPKGFPKTMDEFSVITLQDGDEIIGARWVEDISKATFAFVSEDTSVLAFKGETVRAQGATSGGGVAGFKLADGYKAMVFSVVMENEIDDAVVITHSGTTGKMSKFNLFSLKGRATGGMRAQRYTKADSGDKLAYAFIGVNPSLVDADGKAIELPALDPRRDGSGKPFPTPVG